MRKLSRQTVFSLLVSLLVFCPLIVMGQAPQGRAGEPAQKLIKNELAKKLLDKLDNFYSSPTLAKLEQVVTASKEYLAVPPYDIESAGGNIYLTWRLAMALYYGVECKINPDIENAKAWGEKALKLLESDFAKSLHYYNFAEFRVEGIKQLNRYMEQYQTR